MASQPFRRAALLRGSAVLTGQIGRRGRQLTQCEAPVRQPDTTNTVGSGHTTDQALLLTRGSRWYLYLQQDPLISVQPMTAVAYPS